MLSPKICPARPLRHDVTAASNGTAAYASHRLARRELRRGGWAMIPSGTRGALNRILARVRRTSGACTTPLNPNQCTEAVDNSVEKRCPVEPKSGGCLLLLYLPKI